MSLALATLAEPVQATARDAAERILDIYNAGFTVAEKADRSPVTEADMASHDSIAAGLTDLTPDIPILSEEDAERISFAERTRWDWLWLVDPLDGTREFIRHSDQFSINIALIHDQQAVFGLILIPVSGVCYFAWQHGGAFKQRPEQPPRPIHTCPLGQRPIRVTSSRAAYRGRTLQAYLAYLGRHHHLDVGGALKSCLVAEGQVDLYPRFGPTGEWDTAAAQIIVEEAGGRLTDTQLRPLRYNARPTLINPDFFVFGDPDHDWSQYLPERAAARS